MTEASPPIVDRESQDSYAYCAAIAARNGSPLWQVGKSLPLQKRRFFAAAYASMRIVDDFVDDVFLGLAPPDREAARASARQHLSDWRRGIDAAALGRPPPASGAQAKVFFALSQALPRSDLGVQPWHALHHAMARDIEERPIDDWNDFLAYCEGATVAPAAVFVYILACREQTDGFRWDLPESPRSYAADIAVFCYLVHILRDLAVDAEGDPQLLTIPRTVIAARSSPPIDLRAAILRRDAGPVRAMVQALADQASLHRTRAEQRLTALAGQLELAGSALLTGLFGAYDAVHAHILAEPESVLEDPQALRRLQRTVLQQVLSEASNPR